MSAAHASARFGALAAVAVLTVTVLTGCFANPVEQLVNEGVEGAIEEATGGQVELGGELPADFPADVPVVEGKIMAAAGADGGWVVTIEAAGTDPVADAVAALEAAGFTEEVDVAGDGGSSAVYSNAEHLVLVASDGEYLVYTVSAKQ